MCRALLLAHTPNPDELVAAAARVCYSDVTAADLLKREENALSEKLIESLWRSGHLSTFEHVSFTFAVDGLSRVASHQLVRHRLASFSQQSQRYVKMTGEAGGAEFIVTPPSIANNPEAECIFREQARSAYAAYQALLERGIPAEDARFILPHGWETRLVVTMNARELLHFFELRLCRRAQWEIQALAREMLKECRAVAPVLFKKAGPSCVLYGSCKEAKSCGRPFKDMDELLAGLNKS